MLRTTVAKLLSELLGSTGFVLREAAEVEKHGGLESVFCSFFLATSASVALEVLNRKNAVWKVKQ